MNVTKDRFKDRQLHIEDYLQMVSAEQKEYAEGYVPICEMETGFVVDILCFKLLLTIRNSVN